MLNVCASCGQYLVEKEIRPLAGWRAEAICPSCAHGQPFLRLPLFIVTGASGVGKSALAWRMPACDSSCVHLEGDILWRAEFNRPEDSYRDFYSTWMRLSLNIAQGGRPVVFYGSTVPSNMETLPERRYFSELHYLALVCSPDVLAMRLRARPGWRMSGSEEFVSGMQQFNQWFFDNAAGSTPPITLLDTSQASLDESLIAVGQWIAARWDAHSLEVGSND